LSPASQSGTAVGSDEHALTQRAEPADANATTGPPKLRETFVKRLKLLLLTVVAGSAMSAGTAFAAFNSCRPQVAMELTAFHEVARYLVPRWTTSTYYAVSRLDQSSDGSTYVYAQELCIDVIGQRGAGADGYDWRGTVSLKARDVRLYNPQTRWGDSLGARDVETFEAAHGADGWHFRDVGALGRHADPGGEYPELPGATSSRPKCQPNEAPDANGNCRQWRR
jgi:hypothetical protein